MSDYEVRQPVLTSHEPTLSRVGPSRGRKQHFEVQNSRPAPRREGNPRGPAFKHSGKPRPKPQRAPGFDHDKLLQAYKGANLTIYLSDNSVYEGKLLDGDRYTLMVESNVGDRDLIFKSAILTIHMPSKSEEP